MSPLEKNRWAAFMAGLFIIAASALFMGPWVAGLLCLAWFLQAVVRTAWVGWKNRSQSTRKAIHRIAHWLHINDNYIDNRGWLRCWGCDLARPVTSTAIERWRKGEP